MTKRDDAKRTAYSLVEIDGLSHAQATRVLWESGFYEGARDYPTPGWLKGLLRDYRKDKAAKTAALLRDKVTRGLPPKEGSEPRAPRGKVVSHERAGESSEGRVEGPEPDNAAATDWDLLGSEGDIDAYDLDELLRIADAFGAIMQARDPVYTHGTLRIETETPVGVLFMSCAHLGGRYTQHGEFLAFMRRVLAIPSLYVATLGDDIEGFLPGFPDVEAVTKQPLSIDIQIHVLRLVLRKLAASNRLLFGMAGQHSGDWFVKRYGTNPVKDVYTAAGLPYFDGQAYLKLSIGAQCYNVAVSHKFKGYSMYNPVHAQGRALRWEFPNADVVAQGDKHTYALAENSAYWWEYRAGNRPSPYAWLVQTGTAKSGPDKYTIKGWSQGVFSWPVLIFDPLEHRIEGSRFLKTIGAWLEPVGV